MAAAVPVPDVHEPVLADGAPAAWAARQTRDGCCVSFLLEGHVGPLVLGLFRRNQHNAPGGGGAVPFAGPLGLVPHLCSAATAQHNSFPFHALVHYGHKTLLPQG